MKPPLIIYHIEGRRSFRVIWLCEELSLPYELVFVKGDVLESMVRIRAEFPPMPMAPVVIERDQFVVESGAILDLLCARYGAGKLVPPTESDDYPRHLQWMHFAEGTLMARAACERMVAIASNVDVDAIPVGYRQGEGIRKPALLDTRAIFEFVDD